VKVGGREGKSRGRRGAKSGGGKREEGRRMVVWGDKL